MDRSGCGSLSEGDIEAELMEFFGEAGGQALLVGALEVIGPKIAVIDAFLEHDVDGGEHGRGYRDDSLLGAAAGSEPVEQRLRIAGLDAHGRPGALDQQGLEPGCAMAHPRGAALACALVVAGAQAGPGNQMGRGRKAAHVKADLRQDDTDRMTLADTSLRPGIRLSRVRISRKGS